MKCIICSQEVSHGEKRMFGLDIPYVNVYFHRDCISNDFEINKFLHENSVLVYNYIRNNNEKPVKKERNNHGN